MADKPFDPDAYLAQVEGSGSGFDPDAYLAKMAHHEAYVPNEGESLLRGAGQGLTFDFGDEIGGAVQALGQKILPESMGGLSSGDAAKKGFGDLYRESRDSMRRENDAAQAAHGNYYTGGNVAGGLLTTPLLPGAGEAKGLWALTKAGAKAGTLLGGAAGLGGSRADLTRGDVLGAAKDTAIGAGVGGVLGSALPAVASVAKGAGSQGTRLMSLVRGGWAKPTPEAERLAADGVKLTLGQMEPDSLFGHMEELASEKATGGELAKARKGASASARDVLLKKAGAPGETSPTAGADVGRQLDELKQGFTSLYDKALENERLTPETYLGKGRWRGLLTDESLKGAAKTKGAFELAAADKSIDATPSTREEALSWLRDQARALPRTKSGEVEAKSIQALRTRLRDRLYDLEDATGNDRAKRDIYGKAEEFVSELLHGQLPPEKAAALQAADSSYKNLKAAQSAGKRAFVQNREFTPGQLLMAIREKGSTPALEGAARDAHSVLTAKYPRTGLQVAALEGVPGGHAVSQVVANAYNFSPQLRNWALNPLWQPGLPSKALGLVGSTATDLAGSDEGRNALIRALMQREAAPMSPAAFADSGQ